MQYYDLDTFLEDVTTALDKGPVAIILLRMMSRLRPPYAITGRQASQAS